MSDLHRSHARALSERLYQLLLLAYPRAFREEYAAEMLLTFRDAYCEASRERGVVGVLPLWGDFFYDFVKTVCLEHTRSWMARDGREFALSGQEQLAATTLPFVLRVAQRTDIGRARASNQDRSIALVPEDDSPARARGALFVVSDGMGRRGEIASEIVTQQVRDHYYRNQVDDLPTALQKAIGQASAAIRQANETERIGAAGSRDMGATCVAAVLHERLLYVANVGDSRAYVLHAGQLRQVTRDHSLVARLVERGELTPAAARAHPKPNVIYRALGHLDAEVDLFIERVHEGDTLILCTDGLCGVVEDEELRAIVERYTPEESVQYLIARANAGGGPDNITAVVVRLSAFS
ncbi:MAG TPA: protein phosphatase 2C domain-containing protein [Ktedonobacterales bacterium]|nr:protein phosphatase 2C domain-containing protein [Ktedonobacterales bacterium]